MLSEYNILEQDVTSKIPHILTASDVFNYLKELPNKVYPAKYTSVHTPRLKILQNSSIRDYQLECIQNVLDWKEDTLYVKNGIIEVPCGGGKTHIGSIIAIIATSPTDTSLILTVTTKSVNQWYDTITSWCPQMSVTKLISGKEAAMNNTNCIITTYGMFKHKSQSETIQKIKLQNKSIIVADEVHGVVAPEIFKQLQTTNKTGFIGLTASRIREDEELCKLLEFGPEIAQVKLERLLDGGYISHVVCTTIYVEEMIDVPDTLNHIEKTKLAVLNPNKIQVLDSLLHEHSQSFSKIVIFGDDIDTLRVINDKIQLLGHHTNGPIVASTPLSERESIENKFRGSRINLENNIMLAGRTLDESWDADVDVIIQICTPWGSRRQYHQRIGRVQRKKQNQQTCHAITICSPYETDNVKYRDDYIEKQGYVIQKKYATEQYCNTDDTHLSIESIRRFDSIKKRKRV